MIYTPVISLPAICGSPFPDRMRCLRTIRIECPKQKSLQTTGIPFSYLVISAHCQLFSAEKFANVSHKKVSSWLRHDCSPFFIQGLWLETRMRCYGSGLFYKCNRFIEGRAVKKKNQKMWTSERFMHHFLSALRSLHRLSTARISPFVCKHSAF